MLAALGAVIGVLSGSQASTAAEIRYAFTGFVQSNPGTPLPAPGSVGGSFAPGSTFSGFFSYVQENAVNVAPGGPNLAIGSYQISPGSEISVTNGTETFTATNLSVFNVVVAPSTGVPWDVLAVTTSGPFGPGDFGFQLTAQNTTGIPPFTGISVPGASLSSADFTSILGALFVPSGNPSPNDTYGIPLQLTSIQGQVAPEPGPALGIGSALGTLGLLTARHRGPKRP